VCAKLFSLPDLIEYTDYAFSKCDWDDVETGLRLLSTKRLCKPHKKHIAETITSLNMGDIYDAERKFLDLVKMRESGRKVAHGSFGNRIHVRKRE